MDPKVGLLKNGQFELSNVYHGKTNAKYKKI